MSNHMCNYTCPNNTNLHITITDSIPLYLTTTNNNEITIIQDHIQAAIIPRTASSANVAKESSLGPAEPGVATNGCSTTDKT